MTEEPQANEWQTPPPPELIKKEEPEMSEVATLFNIFIEPGRTFEDLRKKPRFLLATLIIMILATAYGFALYQKVGTENYRSYIVAEVEKNPQVEKLDAAAKNNVIELNLTIREYLRYAAPLIVLIVIAIVGLFYWLGAKAFGGTGNYLHAISVFVYSSLPPAIVGSIASIIVFIFKVPDEIDIAASQRSLIQANPSILIDGKTMPVLATLLASFDLFLIWGWILAAIGLQYTNKISSGSAWAVTIIMALIGIVLRVVGAYFSGNPS